MSSTSEICPPTSLTYEEKQRIRRLAYKAMRLYPGPVGELIHRELSTWEEFGYRLGSHTQMRALLRHLEEAPDPTQTAAAE